MRELLDRIEKSIKDGKIVIIKVNKRHSEGFYNYKTTNLLVIYKNIYTPYEEPNVRQVELIEIDCGAFQQYSIICDDC